VWCDLLTNLCDRPSVKMGETTSKGAVHPGRENRYRSKGSTVQLFGTNASSLSWNRVRSKGQRESSAADGRGTTPVRARYRVRSARPKRGVLTGYNVGARGTE
jgi:hypothetical protein